MQERIKNYFIFSIHSMNKGVWAILICLIIGLIIGAIAGSALRGAIIGLIIGILVMYAMKKKK